MAEIEKANPGLKGVLPKDYNRPALDKVMLGELIDLVSGIGVGEPGDKAKDILGRVYEYFLGGFAGSPRCARAFSSHFIGLPEPPSIAERDRLSSAD